MCMEMLLLYLMGFIFIFNIYLLIYLSLAALGLHCWAPAFSSCGDQGLHFVAVRGLLIVVASWALERRLSSCGTRA